MDPVKCLAQAILACLLFFTTVRQITCAWQNAAHHAEVGKMWLIFKRIIQIPMKLKKVTRPRHSQHGRCHFHCTEQKYNVLIIVHQYSKIYLTYKLHDVPDSNVDPSRIAHV